MGSMDFLMSRRLRISSLSFSRIAMDGATVDWVDRDCKPIIMNVKAMFNVHKPLWFRGLVEQIDLWSPKEQTPLHPCLDSPVTSVSFSFFFFNVLIDLIKRNQNKF